MNKRLMRATPIYWAGFLYALLRHVWRFYMVVWVVVAISALNPARILNRRSYTPDNYYIYELRRDILVTVVITLVIAGLFFSYYMMNENSSYREEYLDKLEAETNKFTKELDEFVKSSIKFYFPRKASCHDWVDIDALCMDSDDNTMWIGTGTGIREPSSDDEIAVVSRGDPFIVRYNGRTYKMLDFGDEPKDKLTLTDQNGNGFRIYESNSGPVIEGLFPEPMPHTIDGEIPDKTRR